MDQEDIDIWMFEAVAEALLGYNPVGINVHRHKQSYLGEETDFSIWEHHKLEPMQ